MLPQSKINGGSSTTEVDENEVVESIQVDDDEIIEVEDANADVNIAAKLPPHGVYMLKWKAGKKEDSIYKSKTKDGSRAFVGVNNMSGAIQEEEFEGIVVFHGHMNSLTRAGKPTSDLHHFLNTVGSPAPNRTTVGQLETHTRETLEQEPRSYAEIDWKAQYKSGKQTKDGKDEYVELKTTMEGFPKHYTDADGNTVSSAKEGKWDGTYVQSIPHPVTGEPIEAKLYIRKFLNQAEANKIKERMRSS